MAELTANALTIQGNIYSRNAKMYVSYDGK